MLGWSAPASATAVTVQQYVEFDDMRAHSVGECELADRHNARVYVKKQAAVVAAKAAGLDVTPVAPPRSLNNVDRRLRWELRNAPVRADDQATAVELLCTLGLRPSTGIDDDGDYQPQRAQQEVSSRGLGPARASAPLAESANKPSDPYTRLSDEEIRVASRAECRRIDRENQRLFTRASRHSRNVRQRVAFLTSVSMSNLQPAFAHVHRKEELENCGVLVPSQEQANAVHALFQRGLRLHVNYLPQNAIRAAAAAATAESHDPPYGSPPPWSPTHVASLTATAPPCV